MTSENKPFDVVVLGSGSYNTYTRRGKSRFLEALMESPDYNVIFITPEDHAKMLPSLDFIFNEFTDIPQAKPLKVKPRPYWRQGERW